MQLELQTQGENLLQDLLSLNVRSKINSFRIGTTAGFVPSKAGVTVSGTAIYVGTPSQIKYSIVSLHEITFTTIIEHDLGDFTAGNIMFFLDAVPGISAGTAPIPFLWASLNSATPKRKSNLDAYLVGNRIILHTTIWFPYIVNALNLSQHEELYAEFPNVATEKQLKSVNTAEFDQYVLDTHSEFDGLTVAVKDNINALWWGQMMYQNIEDPYLGCVQGGISGNGYGFGSDTTYYDGKHYKIDNQSFDIIDGGANWVTATDSPVSGEQY